MQLIYKSSLESFFKKCFSRYQDVQIGSGITAMIKRLDVGLILWSQLLNFSFQKLHVKGNGGIVRAAAGMNTIGYCCVGFLFLMHALCNILLLLPFVPSTTNVFFHST